LLTTFGHPAVLAYPVRNLIGTCPEPSSHHHHVSSFMTPRETTVLGRSLQNCNDGVWRAGSRGFAAHLKKERRPNHAPAPARLRRSVLKCAIRKGSWLHWRPVGVEPAAAGGRGASSVCALSVEAAGSLLLSERQPAFARGVRHHGTSRSARSPERL